MSYDFDYQTFAAKIKEAIANGLDYVAFGGTLGVAGSTICRWASGSTYPHPLIADKVLRELPNWIPQ